MQYLGVLAQGAQPEGSIERQDYDMLRASLAGDNLAARLYAKWLTKFLDGVERFFGDVGMADRTLLPHAFGLKTPAPLWTAPAFNRCLFLALIYPIDARAVALVTPVADAFGDALAAAFVVASVVALTGSVAGAVSVAGQVWQGRLLAIFLLVTIVAGLAAVPFLALTDAWHSLGPLLLFLGLLTLINAPFDWASLGLTRALLRRGLELGGWWPYFLALVDAALAGVIIAALALVMVIGVQAFDELAVHGGGKSVLPLGSLFDGIAKNPEAPEYWWAYALLLSSMIPSLINLMIGGMAFTRGIPWLARRLLQWIPEGKAVPDYRRPLAAIGLTTQMFAGVGLGVAAQAFLVWGLIFHVMPWVGLDLLDMARAVAAFDLPARIGSL
ncbi:MAG TPA: hypothetical protein VIE66_17710 [Methylocella sp.]